jgi:hypothetical protein
LRTHILNYTNKADGAALSNVVFPAAEDERRWYYDVKIEIMGYCTSTYRHLQQIVIQ